MSLLAAASRLLRLLAPRPRAANPRAPRPSRRVPAANPSGSVWAHPRRHPRVGARTLFMAASSPSSSPLPGGGDDARGDTYDEQLAIVRALKSSGAGAERMRVATARLAELKRAGWVPRFTPSRKFAMHSTAAGGSGATGDDAHRDGDDTTAVGEKKRKASRRGGPTVTCPACRQIVKASHPDQFREHLRKCAPDAVSAVAKEQWRDIAAAVDAVEAHEATLLEDARRLSFRDGRTREEVAIALGVSPDRVRSTLRRASRAVPLVADPTPLDVIHEDDDVLVVNKPPGLRFHPVHRFEGNSLLSRAIGHVRRSGRDDDRLDGDAAGDGHAHVPHVVHRLDMDTSGVCVLVKRPELVDGFARQFRGDAGEHRAVKEYLAIGVGAAPRVTGCVVKADWKPPEASGNEQTTAAEFIGVEFTVDAHVGPHASIPEARAVHRPPPTPERIPKRNGSGGDPDAPKPARTDVRIVSSSRVTIDVNDDGDVTRSLTAVLARVRLHTGRTHQIRVHMAHADLPILSDPLYGPHIRWDGASPCADASTSAILPSEVNADVWGGPRWLGRQALHAARLTLRHPETNEEMTFEARAPEDMRGACVALGLDPDAW